jgi:hypothetical protein
MPRPAATIKHFVFDFIVSSIFSNSLEFKLLFLADLISEIILGFFSR